MNARSIADIVDVWLDCTGVKQNKLCEIMTGVLGAPYGEDNFYDDFRRRPSRMARGSVNKLVAVVASFRKVDPTCVRIDDAFDLFEAAGVRPEEFRHLNVFFSDSDFDAAWHDDQRRRRRGSSGGAPAPAPTEPPQDQPFIVGRKDELDAFARFLRPDDKAWIYDIYGPGGIGKSVVAENFRKYARRIGFPTAFLNGNLTDLTPTSLLAQIAEGFAQDEALADFFARFQQEYRLYKAIQITLGHVGGIDEIYDVIGNLKDSERLNAVLSRPQSLGYGIELEKTISNRFALERYLRGAESQLLHQLSEAVGAAKEVSARSLILIVDTYEAIEGLDDWFCRELIPRMNRRMRVAILGRNALTKINFDWKELDSQLAQKHLPELEEQDAKAYLKHYGLNDPAALDQIYRYIGGYPLLLVLVRDLAREVGWKELGALEHPGDREALAGDLLQRILRERGAHDVRAFIEKGCVVDWFNPDIVGVILEISPDEGRQLYDRLRRYSFVERHQKGLKFHDTIKTVLSKRLSEAEANAIRSRVSDYLLQQSGHYAR